MYCSTTPEALNTFVDGEHALWSLDALRLAWHISRCPRCRAIWHLLRANRRIAQSLGSAKLPVSMRERIGEALPAEMFASHNAGMRRSAGRRRALIGATAFAATITLAFFIVPQWGHRDAGSAGAAVRGALAQINTWHLEGWKLVAGRKLPWEVWGRRAPFFYREQVGDELLLDDGSRRTQIMPPDPRVGRVEGIQIVVPSKPNSSNVTWSYTFMAEQFRPGDRPWKETPDTVVFNWNDAGMYGVGTASDNLYTVDKRTWLPTEYEVRRGLSRDPHRPTAEKLRIEYDVPLPDSITRAPAIRAGYVHLDAMESTDGYVPRKNAVTQDGLTVEATPLSADLDGNIVVRVRAWLGRQPLDRTKTVGFNASPVRALDFKGEPGRPIIDRPGTEDDAGRAYVSADFEPLSIAAPGDEFLLLLAPLEPVHKSSQKARSLTMTLRVAPYVMSRPSGNVGGMQAKETFADIVRIQMRLPDPVEKLDPPSWLPKNWADRVRFTDPVASPEASIAEARANYWSDGFNWKDASGQMGLKGRRAIAWQRAALKMMPPRSRTEEMARSRLLQLYNFAAQRYHFIHDDSHATEMLHATLRDSSATGSLDQIWVKLARRDLRSWHLQ